MNFIELNFHCSHTILYSVHLHLFVSLLPRSPHCFKPIRPLYRFLVCDCLHFYLLICALVLSIHISSSPPPCSYSISLIPHLSSLFIYSLFFLSAYCFYIPYSSYLPQFPYPLFLFQFPPTPYCHILYSYIPYFLIKIPLFQYIPNLSCMYTPIEEH